MGVFSRRGDLQQLFQLVLLIGQVGEQRGVRVLGIDEGIQTHRIFHTFEFAGADAVFEKVHGLKADPPLLEVSLRLLGIKTLGFAKNLNIHWLILLNR